MEVLLILIFILKFIVMDHLICNGDFSYPYLHCHHPPHLQQRFSLSLSLSLSSLSWIILSATGVFLILIFILKIIVMDHLICNGGFPYSCCNCPPHMHCIRRTPVAYYATGVFLILILVSTSFSALSASLSCPHSHCHWHPHLQHCCYPDVVKKVAWKSTWWTLTARWAMAQIKISSGMWWLPLCHDHAMMDMITMIMTMMMFVIIMIVMMNMFQEFSGRSYCCFCCHCCCCFWQWWQWWWWW